MRFKNDINHSRKLHSLPQNSHHNLISLDFKMTVLIINRIIVAKRRRKENPSHNGLTMKLNSRRSGEIYVDPNPKINSAADS